MRDWVSFRAKGWLGFMYHGLKLFELKLRSGGGLGKKNKIVQRIIHFVPFSFIFFLLRQSCQRSVAIGAARWRGLDFRGVGESVELSHDVGGRCRAARFEEHDGGAVGGRQRGTAKRTRRLQGQNRRREGGENE